MQTKNGLYDPSQEHDSCGIGLVARLDGESDHRTIVDALTILRNLEHRGAVSGDGKSGDGAGLQCRIPDGFFRARMDVKLPGLPSSFRETIDGLPFAVGMFFLPPESAARKTATALIEYMAAREGVELLCWRDVPVVPQVLGGRALARLPYIVQAAFACPQDIRTGEEFERKLYVLRKCVEREAGNAGFSLDDFSVPSLSCRTIVYKGMFVASQFASFYPDLDSPDFSSPFAVVHQRYSTNTFPSWPLAQPFRMISHNGEINTLRKNINAMRARQSTLESSFFGKDISKLFPVLQEEGSDSAMFDNVFELLVRSGRSPQHAFMMMVPEPWGAGTSEDRRAFYEYHSAVMESWDGPAAMVFCDGISLGAASDRNGLRPFRYARTKDGRFVGASEAGALEIDESTILKKGKLEPGRMLLIDLRNGKLLGDEEAKSPAVQREPYGEWLRENKIELSALSRPESTPPVSRDPLSATGAAARGRWATYFGLDESAAKVVGYMIAEGKEPGSAMGTRKPISALSGKPEPLFSYFRQLFAQVTNPPMDPVREGVVMTLESFIGRERNLLEETPAHCRQLRLPSPVLTNEEMARLRTCGLPDFRVCTVSTVFSLTDEGDSTRPAPGSRLKAAVEAIRTAVELRVDEGYSLVILSDRDVGPGRAAVPSLLALAAANRRLVEAGKRHRTGLVAETGEARETHDICLLVGYGASAVNPWMVFESMANLSGIPEGGNGPSQGECVANYVEAIKKGLLKTLSRMGICSVASYRGGGLYEAMGLSRELVEEFFPGTESRVGGIGLAEIEADVLTRHRAAFPEGAEGADVSAGTDNAPATVREAPWPPKLAALLTRAVRGEDDTAYRDYAGAISSPARPAFALRDLFEFRGGTPVPLSEVEDADEIVRRFSVAAMSCGALSPEAHEALAVGANSAGAWSDSGEGGEDPERDAPGPDGVSRASASRQVASARFGVTARYVASARELQIKMAQGAKPGEGGRLPGAKVNEYIAKLRHAKPGTTLISPPPHHDIYSIEDLSQLIHDLRCANPTARIAVKLAAQAGIGAVAAGTAKAGADCVVVSAGDGGTGSAPLSSLDYVGNSWELSLPEIRQVLAMNGLGDRVSIQVDGRLRNGRDVVIAAILGAREFAFGTAALISLGCLACGQCDRDRCPAGIATQREDLRAKFAGKPEHVARFFRFVARETREILASLGLRSLDDAAGRYDLLDFHGRALGTRGETLDFSPVAQALELAKRYLTLETEGPDGSVPLVLPPPPAGLTAFEAQWRSPFPAPEPDADLMESVCEAFESGNGFYAVRSIRNSDRSIGAALSGELTRKGLSANAGAVTVRFEGSAGQSFGAFLVEGLSFELVGQANDFVGKGLSGGRISVRPFEDCAFAPEDNVIAGNVCLIGATSGEAFFRGRVGERFAIRNSGATAVAEGAGDHACEYMTGGRVVVLGRTGVNFGAGMSGGVAYVLDEDVSFPSRAARDSVELLPLSDTADEALLRADLERHRTATGSSRAAAILSDWAEYRSRFVKVSPKA